MTKDVVHKLWEEARSESGAKNRSGTKESDLLDLFAEKLMFLAAQTVCFHCKEKGMPVLRSERSQDRWHAENDPPTVWTPCKAPTFFFDWTTD